MSGSLAASDHMSLQNVHHLRPKGLLGLKFPAHASVSLLA